MITIQATGEIPIEFEGQLLHEFSNCRVNNLDRTRFHEVKLYMCEESGITVGFVCELQWISQWQGEYSHCTIFDCDTLKQIFDRLNQIDPIEHLEGYPKSIHFEPKQKALEEQIKSDWILMMGKISAKLGLKKQLRRGKPSHPLGTCSNPGWSIPESIQVTIAQTAASEGKTPSEVVTALLAGLH